MSVIALGLLMKHGSARPDIECVCRAAQRMTVLARGRLLGKSGSNADFLVATVFKVDQHGNEKQGSMRPRIADE